MKKCKNCEKEFTPDNPKGVFCSPKCRVYFSRKAKAPKEPDNAAKKTDVLVKDLTEPTNTIKPVTDPPKTTNISVDTRPKKEIVGDSWWQQNRKNKLGIK